MPTIIMFAPVIVLFYFMILRPQQQQEKRRLQTIQALKKNDRVLTNAGIYGTVVSVDPDSDKIVIRVDDDRGVKMAFSKASIARRIDSESEKASATEKAGATS